MEASEWMSPSRGIQARVSKRGYPSGGIRADGSERKDSSGGIRTEGSERRELSRGNRAEGSERMDPSRGIRAKGMDGFTGGFGGSNPQGRVNTPQKMLKPASLAAIMYNTSAKLTFGVGGKNYVGVQKAPGGA